MVSGGTECCDWSGGDGGKVGFSLVAVEEEGKGSGETSGVVADEILGCSCSSVKEGRESTRESRLVRLLAIFFLSPEASVGPGRIILGLQTMLGFA